jgi:hypothetical protein
MSRRALLPLLVVAVGCAWSPAAAAAGASWRLPVGGGSIAGRFAFDRARPFAAGARRGVDLRAAPGAVVLAPCTGRVSFAGRVPGWGGAASVRCGALVASVLGLRRVGVRAGAVLVRGAPLGTADGGSRPLRLGARRRGARHGYVDPLRLVGGEERAPPVVGPPGRRPRHVPRPPVVRSPRVGVRAREGVGEAGVAAWAGAALLAAALGAGVTGRRGARRVASATPCPSTSPRRSTT